MRKPLDLLDRGAGIWSFAAYWFIKTLEYRVLLRIRKRAITRR